MPVNKHLTTIVTAGTPYYRATALGYRTADARKHKKIVNGQGALANAHGGRYNHHGAISVYLAESVETCLAEKMFYFQREVIRSLDAVHRGFPVPLFVQQFVIWEVVFKQDIVDVCDLTIPNAPAFFNVFPSLMSNPSQDFDHLKQRRADIQVAGYRGIKAPSSRCTNNGNMVVVFSDQSQNLQSITPFAANIRLIDAANAVFNNHAVQLLDFTSGEVKIAGAPAAMAAYNNFALVRFNH